MKTRLFLLALLAFGTAALLAFGFHEPSPIDKNTARANPAKLVIRCSPDWEQLNSILEEVSIPPIEGAGNHRWRVSTTNDSAQFYFNQGINMYYSFHIIEAMASFKKAEQFDPASPMLPWAQALAYGPNINDVGYAASPEALAATARASERMTSASDKEKMLIRAMQVRYSADSTQSREHLNQLYADKLKEAYARYPDDPDVAALYADALMLQHPWNLWNNDGTPKPWTPAIRVILEKLLAKTPDHPGANHYYIHVMEPSPYAAKAKPSADRLGKLTPGLSHTVHMPSHIYLRTGQYNKGVNVNEDAVKSYKKLIPVFPAVTGNDFLYIIHNLHMQGNNAMLAGRMAYSVETASETVKSIPGDYLAMTGGLGNYLQYIYMLPVLTDVRFARWDELLEYPQPDAAQVYRNVLYRFGRGMALTAKGRLTEAREELSMLRQLMKEPVLREPFPPFSPSIEGATVAENLLAGSMALAEKNYSGAIGFFSTAATTEENMVYTEPRDWLLNPKHYLGKAYLQAGDFTRAEKTFLRDLQYNNENVWALRGLYQALAGQMKKESSAVLGRFNRAASKADIKITGPVL